MKREVYDFEVRKPKSSNTLLNFANQAFGACFKPLRAFLSVYAIPVHAQNQVAMP